MTKHIIAKNTPSNLARLQKYSHFSGMVYEGINNKPTICLTNDGDILHFTTSALDLYEANKTCSMLLDPIKFTLRANHE